MTTTKSDFNVGNPTQTLKFMLSKGEDNSTVYEGGLQVIGAGFGRTGTSSMQVALEQLYSAPCYHMREVIGKQHGDSIRY